MKIVDYSVVGLLMVFVLILTFIINPKPVIVEVPYPVMVPRLVQVQQKAPAKGLAMLDDVRRDWGIDSRLVCHTEPR